MFVCCVLLFVLCVCLVVDVLLVCLVSAGVRFYFVSLVAVVVLIAVCVDIVEPMLLSLLLFLRACIDDF